MIRSEIFKKILPLGRYAIRNSSQINIEKLEQDTANLEVIDEEAILREEEIERKRNKSRLKVADRNFLHETNPYPEPNSWNHGTLKYIRRTYGRYGQASGVDPAVCWPTEKELKEKIEYEKVAYPFTIPQMIQAAKEKREKKYEERMKRQEDIVKKVAKLEEWKADLHKRIAKKEGEAMASKERKERLIEEVRRHFGYKVDPRDDKFKELLEKKEKEQKKMMKEARKKAKEEKMVEKLLKKKEPETENIS